MKVFFLLIIGLLSTNFSNAHAQVKLAPILGFAQTFLFNAPIPNATISVLETGQIIKTHTNGDFGPIWHPVGKPITLLFSKSGYKTTQSATVIVPEQGLTEPYNQITFQVPSNETFMVFAALVGAKLDEESCHVAATVTRYHKTLRDIPQGEPGTTVSLLPDVGAKPFYFDIFKSGPLKDKTNPFNRNLFATSEDGGVAFFNLPPRNQPYLLSASKKGLIFSTAMFMCRKGQFINLSPPRGPSALN